MKKKASCLPLLVSRSLSRRRKNVEKLVGSQFVEKRSEAAVFAELQERAKQDPSPTRRKKRENEDLDEEEEEKREESVKKSKKKVTMVIDDDGDEDDEYHESGIELKAANPKKKPEKKKRADKEDAAPPPSKQGSSKKSKSEDEKKGSGREEEKKKDAAVAEKKGSGHGEEKKKDAAVAEKKKSDKKRASAVEVVAEAPVQLTQPEKAPPAPTKRSSSDEKKLKVLAKAPVKEVVAEVHVQQEQKEPEEVYNSQIPKQQIGNARIYDLSQPSQLLTLPLDGVQLMDDDHHEHAANAAPVRPNLESDLSAARFADFTCVSCFFVSTCFSYAATPDDVIDRAPSSATKPTTKKPQFASPAAVKKKAPKPAVSPAPPRAGKKRKSRE